MQAHAVGSLSAPSIDTPTVTLLPPCTWGPSDHQTCRLPQSGPILGAYNSVPPSTPAHSQVHVYLPPSQGPGEGVGLGLEGLKFFLGSPASLPAESALGAGQRVLPNLRYVLEGCLRGLHQGGGGGRSHSGLSSSLGLSPALPQMELEL